LTYKAILKYGKLEIREEINLDRQRNAKNVDHFDKNPKFIGKLSIE
jgi:hypothetical protein